VFEIMRSVCVCYVCKYILNMNFVCAYDDNDNGIN